MSKNLFHKYNKDLTSPNSFCHTPYSSSNSSNIKDDIHKIALMVKHLNNQIKTIKANCSSSSVYSKCSTSTKCNCNQSTDTFCKCSTSTKCSCDQSTDTFCKCSDTNKCTNIDIKKYIDQQINLKFINIDSQIYDINKSINNLKNVIFSHRSY